MAVDCGMVSLLKPEASPFNNRTSSRKASDARTVNITFFIDPGGVAPLPKGIFGRITW